MPAFFAHERGTVSRVDSLVTGSGILPFNVVIEGTDIGGRTNPQTRAIITQAVIKEKGNYQFLHTLSETIYVYVFGDRIGELIIGGICFSSSCDKDSQGNDLESGMKQIHDAYQENKLSVKGGPIVVNFGEVPLRGFLVGMSIDVSDPERNLGQWAYQFRSIAGDK